MAIPNYFRDLESVIIKGIWTASPCSSMTEPPSTGNSTGSLLQRRWNHVWIKGSHFLLLDYRWSLSLGESTKWKPHKSAASQKFRLLGRGMSWRRALGLRGLRCGFWSHPRAQRILIAKITFCSTQFCLGQALPRSCSCLCQIFLFLQCWTFRSVEDKGIVASAGFDVSGDEPCPAQLTVWCSH